MESRYFEQITALIASASHFGDKEFRMLFEDLVKKGGKETEDQIILYITGNSLPTATRQNLIRIAGYLRHSGFITPLKHVIDHETDMGLKMEAIISIAKYNDHKALEILNRALETIDNPKLLDTIKTEIGKIKQNNPVIAMMPNFLSGSADPDIFLITLKILKKIITADDLMSFIPYLHHPDFIIRRATFELLCLRGNESVASYIIRFLDEFAARLKTLHSHEAPFCLWALQQFGQFAAKFPHTVAEAVPVLLVIQKKMPFLDIKKRIETLLTLLSTNNETSVRTLK